MSRLRQFIQKIGKVGAAFLVGTLLFLVVYLLNQPVPALVLLVILVPLGIILIFRGMRLVRQHSLWSLRNRLLVVYGLVGVLPLLLLFALVGIGTWALLNELAIYLASSALDRRLEVVNYAAETFRKLPPAARIPAIPELAKAFDRAVPGICFYMRDGSKFVHYPPTSPNVNLATGWNNVSGLAVLHGHFYAWAHWREGDDEGMLLAPLSDQVIANLVPHLGPISLLETHTPRKQDKSFATAGALMTHERDHGRNTDFDLRPTFQLPPAMSWYDIPVFIPSTRSHYHLDEPNRQFDGVLQVSSRPSAVLQSFFSGSEVIRGLIYDSLVVIAVLFFLVELGAAWIGLSLSRRVTRSVNQLYEGTRRVIHGDFRHRIQVTDHDQLGELAVSFNQMTENLERLVSVEKEKERLQTELEIAREVQGQLYPKEAPPSCGLQLTVRCDPARLVSGDYYDYADIAMGKLAFAIGDVAGKGISAALLMATLQAALRAQISHYQPLRPTDCADDLQVDAASLVSKLNRQLYAHTSPEKYATFFFALFDESSRTLTYTNAGHLSPLLFRNGDVTPLDSNGTVVGAFPFAKYTESCLILEPGDLLVCYTDGITEPENAYGEMFGEERLIELVKRHAQLNDHDLVQTVLEAVRSWTGSPELHDDMTLLLAREVQPA